VDAGHFARRGGQGKVFLFYRPRVHLAMAIF
jgi:hypothetical protein